jgi:AraC-like DNA-binding protein
MYVHYHLCLQLFQLPDRVFIDHFCTNMPSISLAHVHGVIGCGQYQQKPGTQPSGPTLAPGREKVELVTAGRGWIQHDGSLVEVLPGALIWHMPGDRMICRSDEVDPYSCLAVTWQVETVARQVPRVSRWNDISEITAYTRQLVTAYSDERIDRRTLAISSYAHLHWRAHLYTTTASDPVLPAPLLSLLKALEANPADDWSTDDMAQIAGCSLSRLHGLFRTYLRSSPHQHLLDLRMRLARELLATGHDDLASIARRCGLMSAAALCRRFRRATGMTAGAYRAQQR